MPNHEPFELTRRMPQPGSLFEEAWVLLIGLAIAGLVIGLVAR